MNFKLNFHKVIFIFFLVNAGEMFEDAVINVRIVIYTRDCLKISLNN